MNDAVAARPSRSKTDKREEVLTCAAGVFNRLGLRGATLADVAAELGMNLTSIRHYFSKREDLVEAVVLESFEENQRWLADALKEATPEARLRRLMRNMFDFRRRVAEGAAPAIIHFSELRSMRPPYSDRVWPRYADMFRAYRAIVSTPEEIAEHRLLANARGHVLLSQCLRLVIWLPAYAAEDYGRVERHFLDILMNGLSADGRWTPRPVELPPLQAAATSSMDAFLAAATRIINEEGYRGASVQRIAASLNVTKGSFYHHISAKDDLVAACCDRTARVLSEAQRLALQAETKGLDQAAAAVGALALLQLTPGTLLRSSALMSMGPDARADFSNKLERISLRFADMISDGLVDGSSRVCDARIAGDVLMAFVASAEESARWVPGLTRETTLSVYSQIIFRGLLHAR